MSSKTKAAGVPHEVALSGVTPPEPEAGPSREEIQQRAYEIHLARDGGHGRDLEDWLQAELELKGKYGRS